MSFRYNSRHQIKFNVKSFQTHFSTSEVKKKKWKDFIFWLYIKKGHYTTFLLFHLYCRWSQGLLFHQGAVDCARAALLLPLGISILHCQPVQKCSLVETAFLLLVTVATVNMLTTVLNDSPVFPEDDDNDVTMTDAPLLMDSPQCVLFGTFMIWFASITINLGPTFLSGKQSYNY